MDIQQLKDQLRSDVKSGKAIEPLLKDYVNSIVCDEHNKPAKFLRIENNTIVFDSCCEKLQLKVQEKVRYIEVNITSK